MRTTYTILRCTLVVMMAISMHTYEARAQETLPTGYSAGALVGGVDDGLEIEWLRPQFTEGDGLSFFSSALRVAGQFRLAPKMAVTAWLPITYRRLSGTGGGSDTETKFGNPYIGVRYVTTPSVVGTNMPPTTLEVEVGVYVPVSSGPALGALAMGYLSDFDRLEAYLPETFTAQGRVDVSHRTSSGLRVEAGAGPSVLVYTSDRDESSDLFAHYGVQVWYDAEDVGVGVQASGVAVMTSDGGSLADNTVHHIGLHVAGYLSGAQPHVFVRFPLDEDLREGLNFILGVGVVVGL